MKLFHWILALAMAAALLCTGCSSSQQTEPVNIAFLVGIADKETKVNEGIDELQQLPAMPGTSYAFISIEGVPVSIGTPGVIADLTRRGYTSEMMKRVEAGIRADLMTELRSYRPVTEGIDLAAAIQLGVRQLHAQADGQRKNILVLYCSGKSTRGLINQVETPVCRLDVEGSVSALADKIGVDMSDVDQVIWYCCGDFAGEGQTPLSGEEKDTLKQFYRSLFMALGMEEDNIVFRDDLPESECYQFNDAPVPCVEAAGQESGLQELDAVDFAREDALRTPVVLPEETVAYQPDSTEFLHPQESQQAMEPLVDFLQEHAEVQVLLYGGCAGDKDTPYSLQLGRDRAETIRQYLMDSGIEEARLTAVSVPVQQDPYHVYGLGTDSEEASVNRHTVIVDASTDFARQILQNAQ